MEPLEPVVQGILYLVALVLFVLAAVNVVTRVSLVAAGLSFFTVPWVWNSFAAA